MVHSFLLAEGRYPSLPDRSSRWQPSSLDQVMPYAELLNSVGWSGPSRNSGGTRLLNSEYWSTSSAERLLGWACREAERLGGLEGLAHFSKIWAGSEKSEVQQWNFFLSQKRDIRSSKDADQLMEFLAENDQSENISHLRFMAENWAGTDLKGASNWIKEQPPGPARDQMLEGLLSGLDWADEAAVDQWIPLIHDDLERAKRLKAIEDREAPYRK